MKLSEIKILEKKHRATQNPDIVAATLNRIISEHPRTREALKRISQACTLDYEEVKDTCLVYGTDYGYEEMVRKVAEIDKGIKVSVERLRAGMKAWQFSPQAQEVLTEIKKRLDVRFPIMFIRLPYVANFLFRFKNAKECFKMNWEEGVIPNQIISTGMHTYSDQPEQKCYMWGFPRIKGKGHYVYLFPLCKSLKEVAHTTVHEVRHCNQFEEEVEAENAAEAYKQREKFFVAYREQAQLANTAIAYADRRLQQHSGAPASADDTNPYEIDAEKIAREISPEYVSSLVEEIPLAGNENKYEYFLCD